MTTRALLVTVRADLRPAFGFVIGMLASSTVLASVVRGALSIVSASADPEASWSALESVIQVSVVAAGSAAFISARALALSLAPDFQRLRAIGSGSAPLWGFGMLSVVATVGAGAIVAMTFSGWIALRWASPLADLLGTSTPRAGNSTVSLVSAALVLPAIAGWWFGTRPRKEAPKGRTRRLVIGACATAVVFIAPTLLAVVFASELTAVVRMSGEEEAAGRLASLDAADGPLAILSAAVFGVLGAAVILTPLLTRVLLGAAARCMLRQPLVVFTGLRTAQNRTSQFGALGAVAVAACGLVDAHALTGAAARFSGSRHSGAGLQEIGLTLGPALLIAAACSVGATLAQSRGTGTELRSLRRLGMRQSGSFGMLVVAAVALGVIGVLLSAAAATAAWLIAVCCGLDISSIAAIDLTAPAAISLTAISLFSVVFLGSELLGAAIDGR